MLLDGGQRALKFLMLAYIVGLFAASFFALICWNSFLRDSLGRLLSVEQIHVIEYTGLGIIGAARFHRTQRSWHAFICLFALLAAVGLGDELFQLLLPKREFQWSDVFFNALGSVLGLLLYTSLLMLRRLLGAK